MSVSWARARARVCGRMQELRTFARQQANNARAYAKKAHLIQHHPQQFSRTSMPNRIRSVSLSLNERCVRCVWHRGSQQKRKTFQCADPAAISSGVHVVVRGCIFWMYLFALRPKPHSDSTTRRHEALCEIEQQQATDNSSSISSRRRRRTSDDRIQANRNEMTKSSEKMLMKSFSICSN